MPENPVCTCIKRTASTRYGDVRLVQVFDPFCQIPVHKERGTSPLDPTYPKAAGNG
jgi:CO dehydrogenase/acetyl-CoA synthase gamma subunit (corrinoid Fe-S protein)